jgi:pantoate--beta-alanine ligase
VLPQVLAKIATAAGQGRAAQLEAVAEGRRSLLAAGFDRIDYLEVADEETLQPATDPSRPARVFAAAWLGRTRLIDNRPVENAVSRRS